jgi:hypothetical protein
MSVIAYSLVNSNSNTGSKYPNGNAHLDVDVVYAYFSTQPVSENVTGLYKNSNNQVSDRYTTGSFFVVLNVTNYSNVSVVLNEFCIDAAQHMNFTYTANQGSVSIDEPFFAYHQTDNQHENLTSAYNLVWRPYESRLIAFSGITQLNNRSLLQAGTFYVGGRVAGSVINGSYAFGGGAKLIQVENFGDEYLYNNLVTGNETLRVYPFGLDVEIVPGR